jgi:small subunit ribosomal protein S16
VARYPLALDSTRRTMVKIRLKRVGKRKHPSYRVVVADSRSPRDGRNIESIGSYQPRLEPSGVAIDNDRAVFWLRRGAQPSAPVEKLLRISGAWSMFTGEAPPAQPAPARATPAASVTEAGDASGRERPEPPEAVDQQPAPDSDLEDETAPGG